MSILIAEGLDWGDTESGRNGMSSGAVQRRAAINQQKQW